ncbi:hypothetical protein KFK09_014735 [Dendrobium nobile]|uniref:Uncharacterized protein n=1 Tax=Dendrobium nobile TaxID=94219 RepID=A0A8T3B3Y1_DENNO|nr:hypothetical protein KFK09_014735 [Dendrobium nobile]
MPTILLKLLLQISPSHISKIIVHPVQLNFHNLIMHMPQYAIFIFALEIHTTSKLFLSFGLCFKDFNSWKLQTLVQTNAILLNHLLSGICPNQIYNR